MLREETLRAGVKLGPASVSKADARAGADLARKYADDYLRAKLDYLMRIAGESILTPAALANGGP